MWTGRPLTACIAAFAVGTWGFVSGCRPELPDPPDPDDPTPGVECEQGGPLGLERTSADSALPTPSWFEACTLCPVDAIELSLTDAEGADVPAFVAWTEAGSCAAVLPLSDPPGAESLQARARLVHGRRAGSFEFDFALAPPLDPAPDAGGSVFRFDWADARPRTTALAALFEARPGRPFLLALAEGDGGSGAALLATTDSEGRLQDPCEPTRSPTAPASLSEGRLALPFGEGDALLQPLPLTLRGGALRAHLAEDGGGLRDVVLAGRLDLEAMQAIWGRTPEEACAEFDETGLACAPCADPADGLDDPSLCLTLTWEWSAALRTGASVTPVEADDLPPECLGDDDDSAARRADPGERDSAS